MAGGWAEDASLVGGGVVDADPALALVAVSAELDGIGGCDAAGAVGASVGVSAGVGEDDAGVEDAVADIDPSRKR